MVPPHAIDTKSPSAVADALASISEFSGERGGSLVRRAVSDVAGMFEGKYPGYQAIQMEYHDLDHTFQVTVCMAHLLKGRSEASALPVLSARDQELAILSALLHDTGFLKETGDSSGTGAKYTFVHEQRSCVFARKYLPELGLHRAEIEDICSAIRCTGPAQPHRQRVFQKGGSAADRAIDGHLRLPRANELRRLFGETAQAVSGIC